MKENYLHVQGILNEGLPFKIMDIDGRIHINRPLKMDGGAIGLCLEGDAEVIVGTERYNIGRGHEIVLLDDSQLFINRCSRNFRMSILLYSKSVAFQAQHKFDPSFFNHMMANPIYIHRNGSENMLLSYFRIFNSLQSDRHNRYNVLIATNLLRSMMLNIYDKIQRFPHNKGNVAASRKEEIFDKFIGLMMKHYRRHRDVAYYADKLCISARYLSEVSKEIVSESPKQIIDRHIISEIKLMLTFSDMTIQQIADYLHFPDRSYLGRYFKHYSGMSPSAYRMQEMVM